MGGYYARNDGEDSAVATAISEHYHPRFSGDTLPSTKEGLCVAIADKVDSIVGIYGIGHKPTGSKDPYALKRAGLGLLRMIIEAKLELGLALLVSESAKLHNFDNNIAIEINEFIVSRLEAYYQEKGIDKTVVKSVLMAQKNIAEGHSNSVYDWHLRIETVHEFMQDENSKSLIEANKRIKNMLKDTSEKERIINEFEFDGLLDKSSEFDKNLHQALGKLTINQDYPVMIKGFLSPKPTIDAFFDNVMINDEDEDLRRLRLNSIEHIRNLFLHIADFAYLSK
jgi:glycyl-tRNA synthetase beta chain